jgi:hypothetical protein
MAEINGLLVRPVILWGRLEGVKNRLGSHKIRGE